VVTLWKTLQNCKVVVRYPLSIIVGYNVILLSNFAKAIRMVPQKHNQKLVIPRILKGVCLILVLCCISVIPGNFELARASSGESVFHPNQVLSERGSTGQYLREIMVSSSETATETVNETATVTPTTTTTTTVTEAPTPYDNKNPVELSTPTLTEFPIKVTPSPTDELPGLNESVYFSQGSTIFLPLIFKSPPAGYYVSTTGSDSNPGSFLLPWKTIQKAANTAKGGETVYIRGGTYNQRVVLSKRGNTSGPYITFSNYPGETVILDGTGIAIQYGFGLFHVEETDFIRITGLTIQHSNGAGIYVGYANHIILDNNHTYDTVKSGIGIWRGSNVVVDHNDIALACNAHPNYPATEENITIAASSSFVEVKNNYVHQAAIIPTGYSGGEGINIKDGSHEIFIHNNVVNLARNDGLPSTRLAYGLDGWQHETYNIHFYNNLAYNSYYGFVIESEAGATVHDVYVNNNISFNNGTGYTIPNWAQNETSLKRNIQFVNNTSYNNLTGIFINSAKIENIIIRNNLFWQDGTAIKIGSGVPAAQITTDHNLTNTNPLFINPAGLDFHIQLGSPAIDSGTNISAPVNDFDGNNRPQGIGFDVGAYEFVIIQEPTPAP